MNGCQPRTVLVTGGAGFIGSYFVRIWLATQPNIRIVTLDRLTYSGSLDRLRQLPNPHRHTFIHGDICNQRLVESILREHEVNCIVHFAAEIHVDRSISGPALFVQTNIVGTFTLLEAARQYWLNEKKWNANQCRFHQVSTDEVYGSLRHEDPPFTESSSYHPNSPYAASKASGDHLAWSYFHTYGLPVSFSNCSNNYGPAQQPEAFIPTVIRSCLHQRPIPIYGDGSNRRDWLFVEDHCHGITQVILKGRPGGKYNFGGGSDRINLEVVQLICDLLDRWRPQATSYASLMTFVKDRPGHDWRYAVDDRKARLEFGWKPVMDFQTGMEKTVGWYLQGFFA
ncbi:MAG: dTDP-glucose 4,6-dehydratase [Magnetococcus sp. YQC-5]